MEAKTYRYKLSFGPNIQDIQKKVPNLVLEEPDTTQLQMDRLSHISTYNISVEAILFERKVYQPGVIYADIAIEQIDEQDKDLITPKELADMLLSRKVDLFIRNDVNATVGSKREYEQIAMNYYVHEIYPQVNRDLKQTVKLTIYSMDKLMTLNKYSKAFTVKKLSKILSDEITAFGFRDRFLKADTDNMRSLIYLDESKEKHEFIHPYLVQYNETFYDFMVRTANRCGEFLYFEDGLLYLGLKVRKNADKKTDADPLVIKDFTKVTFQSESIGPLTIGDYARDSVKDFNYKDKKDASADNELNNDTFDLNDAGYPKDAFPEGLSYNSEVANDEYVYILYKDKFQTLANSMGLSSKDDLIGFAIEITSTALSNTNGLFGFAEQLTSFAYDMATRLKDAAIAKRDDNKSGNKDYIEALKDETEQATTEKAVHFANLLSDCWTTVNYYQDVRQTEERLKRETICIDMGTKYASVKLGDKIKVDNMEGVYVVIQISQKSQQDWTRIYEKYDDNTVLGIQNEGLHSQKIFAIPVTTDNQGNEKIMPPLQSVPYIRKSGPQTAFVTDNSDPKGQGRVRIAFPWQSVAAIEKVNMYNVAREQTIEEQKAQILAEDVEEARKQRAKKREFLRYFYADEKDPLELMNAEIQRLKARKSELDKIAEDEETFKTGDSDKTAAEGDRSHKAQLIVKRNETKALKKETQNRIDKLLKIANNLTDAQIKELDNEKATLKQQQVQINRLDAELGLWENKKKEYKAESKELEAKIKELEAKCEELNKKKQDIETERIEQIKQAKQDIKDPEELNKKLKEIDEEADAKWEKAEKEMVDTMRQEIAKDIQQMDAEIVKKDEKRKQQEIKADNAGKVTGDKAGQVKKTIGKSATPWIRVSTPMATQGGGFYFTPAQGDEVLVNFDNDNVERPYVVGSLYSKNLSNPQGMSIVSPNGHTIQFDNPGNGTKVVESLFPALKIWKSSFGTTFFGAPEFMGLKDNSKKYKDGLKSMKDFTGGIHFKDRYGFYDINMCSDKRSISISSPLGKVSMSALQGITISAPNGDVTIEGKNVTIKAGNNLTLSSGGNVRDKKEIAEAAKELISDLAGSVIKDTIGQFTNIIDLALVRTALEVIVRPVEGTTLIKSKRYLKLEAGKGKAMIQRDRYKPGHRMKHHGEEMFAYLMQHAISAIDTGFDKFFDTYAQLKAEAFKKQIVYEDYARILLRKMDNADNPDVRKKAFTFNTNNDWKHGDDCVIKKADYLKEGVLKDSILAFFKNGVHYSCGTPDKKAEYMQKVADEYGEAIYKLHKHVLSLGAETNTIKDAIITEEMKKEYHKGWVTMLKRNTEVACLKADPKATKAAIAAAQTAALTAAGTTENGTDYPYSWVDDAASNKYDLLITSDKGSLKKWKDRYGDSDPKDAFLGTEDKETEDDVLWATDEKPLNKSFLKRNFAVLLLKAAADNEEGKKFVSLKYLKDKKEDDIQNICKDNAKWEEFVENMDRSANAFARGLWDVIGENLKGLWDKSLPQMADWRWKDAEHWDDAKGGQILFSDKKNQTIRMEGTELKADEESHKYTDTYYKGLIKGLE